MWKTKFLQKRNASLKNSDFQENFFTQSKNNDQEKSLKLNEFKNDFKVEKQSSQKKLENAIFIEKNQFLTEFVENELDYNQSVKNDKISTNIVNEKPENINKIVINKEIEKNDVKNINLISSTLVSNHEKKEFLYQKDFSILKNEPTNLFNAQNYEKKFKETNRKNYKQEEVKTRESLYARKMSHSDHGCLLNLEKQRFSSPEKCHVSKQSKAIEVQNKITFPKEYESKILHKRHRTNTSQDFYSFDKFKKTFDFHHETANSFCQNIGVFKNKVCLNIPESHITFANNNRKSKSKINSSHVFIDNFNRIKNKKSNYSFFQNVKTSFFEQNQKVQLENKIPFHKKSKIEEQKQQKGNFPSGLLNGSSIPTYFSFKKEFQGQSSYILPANVQKTGISKNESKNQLFVMNAQKKASFINCKN